jgi:hypothetical protein
MTYYTTLNKISEHQPCSGGWKKLLRSLGKTEADDDPLSLMTILDSNGLTDALWCLRAFDDVDKDARLFAVWCARQVQHLMTDPRSIAAIDVAERYVNCDANGAELAAAWDAASAAAWDAANAAGWAAARAAASAAGWAAASAAERAAARASQEAEFRQRFGDDEWPGVWVHHSMDKREEYEQGREAS